MGRSPQLKRGLEGIIPDRVEIGNFGPSFHVFCRASMYVCSVGRNTNGGGFISQKVGDKKCNRLGGGANPVPLGKRDVLRTFNGGGAKPGPAWRAGRTSYF